MMIQRIVQRILESQVLTSPLESQINKLLWKREYDSEDMKALADLVTRLSDGSISSS